MGLLVTCINCRVMKLSGDACVIANSMPLYKGVFKSIEGICSQFCGRSICNQAIF